VDDAETELSRADLRDLRRIAGIMIPASTQYRVPGADDDATFADIVRSLGRDRDHVRKALAMLATSYAVWRFGPRWSDDMFGRDGRHREPGR
jgi:hypothetical protein